MKQRVLYIISSIIRSIFSHRFMRGVNLAMYHVALRGMGILNYENSLVSGESYLLTKLTSIDVKTIVEVGAHDGSDTIIMHDLFPQAQIHSFEPHPGNFAKLKTKTSGLPFVTIINKGLGVKQGRHIIWDHLAYPKGSQHATLHKEVISKLHKSKEVGSKVQLTTLDSYSKSQKISKIDYLKIDTEGHELDVLRGSKKLIKNNRISYIQLEFNSLHAYSRVFMKDIMDELTGYTWYRLLPKGFLPLGTYNPITTEIFAFQNLLAIAPKRKDITKD